MKNSCYVGENETSLFQIVNDVSWENKEKHQGDDFSGLDEHLRMQASQGGGKADTGAAKRSYKEAEWVGKCPC